MSSGHAAGSRAAAIEAELERRRRQEAARSSSEAAAGVDGFRVRRWRRAGVFGAEAVHRIEALLAGLPTVGLAAPDPSAANTIRAALDGEPTPQLPGAVAEILRDVPPDIAVTALKTIHLPGVAWLADWARARMVVLTENVESMSGAVAPSRQPQPTIAEDPAGALVAYLHATSDTLDQLPLQRIRMLLPWAPMSFLDDLIGAGALQAHHEPWKVRSTPEEAAYLRARLAPETLATEGATRLDWPELEARTRFLSGDYVDGGGESVYDRLSRLADGDEQAAKELQYQLPRDLVARVRRVFDGAQVGTWDPDIIEDRGLWRLMAAIWEPKAAVAPERSPLHALVALRNAYELITAGQLSRAWQQVRRFVEADGVDDALTAEAWNMAAYLHLQEEDLEEALSSLGMVNGVDAAGVLHNFALIEQRRTLPRNDRSRSSNPYLDLGIPNNSVHAEARWKQLRVDFRDDAEASARVNRAITRIRAAEREDDRSDFFVLPLNPAIFELPTCLPVSLVPPLSAMPRTTFPGEGVEALRRKAILDVLPGLLSSPQAPDRYGRTDT